MALCTPARLRGILSAAVAGAATVAGSSIAAERPWIEVRTPHFVVVANTSEGTARDVGWQFEQVRYVFETLWPWARRARGRPFYVIAVRGESDMRALAPEFWEKGHDGTVGVAVSGPDKDYVALQAGVALPDNLRTNPYFYAYWGYANRALQAAFPGALPLWYARGLSDLFGNTVVRGKDVQLGRMLMHHVEQLGRSSRMPLPELLAVDRNSKYYTDESRRAAFDAESWMFVHYLVFGDKGVHQAPSPPRRRRPKPRRCCSTARRSATKPRPPMLARPTAAPRTSTCTTAWPPSCSGPTPRRKRSPRSRSGSNRR